MHPKIRLCKFREKTTEEFLILASLGLSERPNQRNIYHALYQCSKARLCQIIKIDQHFPRYGS